MIYHHEHHLSQSFLAHPLSSPALKVRKSRRVELGSQATPVLTLHEDFDKDDFAYHHMTIFDDK